MEGRFLKPENRALVLARDNPSDLLQALEEWRPMQVEKWLSRETRQVNRRGARNVWELSVSERGTQLATNWLPFLAKSVWLNVPLLMRKQHSPTGTR